MKIQDGSIKVLIIDYKNMAEPSEIPAGVLFQNSVLSLSETPFLLNNLNGSAGWHYRNEEFVIQGTKYVIAQIYEEETPISKIYPKQYVDFNDTETIQKLLNSCVPKENLGAPAELFTYTKQAVVETPVNVQHTPITTSDSTGLGELEKYLTPDERATLNMMDEEQLENLYADLEERKGQAMISEMVSYELPQELSNYNLIYREYIINKSVRASEGSDADVNQIKHEIGLKEVLNHMVLTPNVINQESTGAGADDDFITANFNYLSNYLSQVFRNLGEVPIDTNIQLSFTTTRQDIIAKIKTAYGSYTNFVDRYLQLKVGESILPNESVIFEDLNIEFKVVKSYDNIRGFGINFAVFNEELQSDYLFPYPLFRAIGEYSSAIKMGNFKSVYNALLEPYLAEVGLNGLNLDKMKLQNHEVIQIPCEYMGGGETEGQILYVFRNLNEDKYFVVYKTALSNRLLGTKYVLMGHNFEINYRADNVYVKPTSKPRLTDSNAVIQFIDGLPNDKLGEVYKPYYSIADAPTVKSIENLEIRKIAENYEQLLESTAKLGYTWNIYLTDADVQLNYTEDTTPNAQTVDIFAQQPTQPVDIFAQQPVQQPEQPVDIFAQQPQQTAQMLVQQEQPQQTTYEQVPAIYNEYGLRNELDRSNNQQVEETVVNLQRMLTEGKDSIVFDYLLKHKYSVNTIAEFIGMQTTFETDPNRDDNKLGNHEFVGRFLDNVISNLKLKSETATEGDFTIMEGTKIADSLKKIQNVYTVSSENEQQKISEMLEFVTEFINKFK